MLSRPPLVRQTAEYSCWAAAMESWSRADHRLLGRTVTQAELIAAWSGRPLPDIAAHYNCDILEYAPRSALQLYALLENVLHVSYVWIHWRPIIGGYSHAVVIWHIDRPNTTVSYMDPSEPRYLSEPAVTLLRYGAVQLLRPRRFYMLYSPLPL